MRSSRNEADETSKNTYRMTLTLINLTNMISFASGLILFIIGLLYLTSYRYEFSFTVYSIDMVAGFFVGVGVITLFISLGCLATLTPFENPQLATISACWTFLVFVWFFITGVVGLSLNSTGQFSTEIRNNMYQTARFYEEMVPHKLQTKRLNWVQTNFECCGIDSYVDWKAISLGGPYRPGEPFNFNNNFNDKRFPFTESVPDSCCVQRMPGCGKNIYSFERDRTFMINTKGCYGPYTRYFSRDVAFLAGIAVAFGVLFLVLTILFVSLTGLIRKNVKLLESSISKQEKRVLISS